MTPKAERLFVVLEETREALSPRNDSAARRPPFRLLLRRLYAGENKSIDTRCAVAVGYDLSSNVLVATTLDFSVRTFVSATPPGNDTFFEGVFDLRALDIARIEQPR
jgi:hypothetical protein